MRARVIMVLISASAFWGSLVFRTVPAQGGISLTEPVPLPSWPVDQDIPEVADAIVRFQKLDLEEALVLLKAAAEKHRDLPPAQVIMAQLFAQANQRGAAHGALQIATVEAPDDPEAYVMLGELALRDGRITEAYLLCQRAHSVLAEFSKSPKRKKRLQTRVFASLTAVAEAREQWCAAQKHLEAWLEVEPENAAAIQQLARALFKQKKVQGAMDTLKKAVKADANVLNWAAQLALFYEQDDDREAAEKWMTCALKLKPKDLRTRLVAARWFLDTGQFEKAREHSIVALQIDPNSVDAKLLRGVVALFEKDYQTGEQYFEEVLHQSPGTFAASNNLALALCEQDDVAKRCRAVEIARANAKRYPESREVSNTLRWVLDRSGQLDKIDEIYEIDESEWLKEAQQLLQALIGEARDKPDRAYSVACFLADHDRKEEAKQLLRAALKSERFFAKRQQAEALLKKLTK